MGANPDREAVQYFAYGSNLLCSQMSERTGLPLQECRRGRVARLPGHRLVFNKLGRGGEVYANVVAPGDGVVGVVYACDEEMLAKLDRQEPGYDRIPMTVVDEAGVELIADVYVAGADFAGPEGRPSPEYLRKIFDGAREHGLSEEYLRQIEAAADGNL